jgi:hypothetical protein
MAARELTLAEIRRQKTTFRIILGPTPWRLTGVGATNPSLEIQLLKKTRAGSPSDEVGTVYYDSEAIAGVIGYSPDERFNRLLDDCVKDSMCYYLAERERTSVFDGPLSAAGRIAELASYALYLCETHRPDIIVFHNYPHELFTYILLRATEYADVRTFIIHFSVLPWRMRISYVGRNLELHSIVNPEARSDEQTAHVLTYYERLRGSHDDAMPVVDRALRKRAGDSFLSLRGELGSLLRSNPVKQLTRVMLKLRSFRALQDVTVPQPRGPYVVFFLHYQPEESTLPRGGIFAQQLIAIAKLRSITPPDVGVLVKEHPSMFRYDHTLSIVVRNSQFYEFIQRLRGVYVVPQETDTFTLIDNARAVATITGTVAIEALARGKPVICFGEAYYKHFAGVTSYRDILDAPKPFAEPHNSADTRADLLRECAYSFGRVPSAGLSDVDRQQEAAIMAYQHLFANVHEMLRIADEEWGDLD